MTTLRSLAASAALAVTATVATACSDAGAPTHAHDALAARERAHMGAETGTTGGWGGGRDVTFFYNKPFSCVQPPSSGATSGCALGAEPETPPRGGRIPVLYVLVPLGFRPAEATLQCPEVGACINHPSTIDLSRVFGAGTENALLPAHSHLVGDEESRGANAGWWEIEVVGVTEPAVWSQLAQGRSLPTLRALQAAGAGITGDIPTNLFLFFGVRP